MVISSDRVSSKGLPVFALSTSMTSSSRRSSSSAMPCSADWRRAGVLRRHSRKARCAAAIARSTSSRPDSACFA